MSVETERKFLIKLPDFELIQKNYVCRTKEIVQTYLNPPPAHGKEQRVRKIKENGAIKYVYTRKEKITAVSRNEYEHEITEEEYAEYMKDAYSELSKTRYAFEYSGHTIEIDVYPYEIGGDDLIGKCILEVELEAENENIDFPPEIEILRELTGMKLFSNKAMAKPVKHE